MTPGTGSYPAGASGGRSYPSSGMPPSGGSYATGGAGGSSYPATRSGSGADATPFRSPSGVMPRGDSMSDRAGDDRFSPPSDRSPVGGPAYTSPFDATSPARSGAGASYYNAPSSSASPATGGYDPNVRTARADATRAPGGTNPFGGQGAAGSDFRPNSAAGDFRSGSPASDYRPGATGYNPPASDYRPGETGYNPPTTDYRSGTSGASPSGASQYPYRMPTSSTNSPATGADDGAPYLPGSSKQFSPRTTVAGAPSGGFGGTASAARTDSSVSPAGYNQTNPNMGRL
jgi:hypothetical protein